jgi:hypothetical protein
MQTIKTEHGTYTIKNDRDPGEFMRKLAKPAARKRAEKAPVRTFPRFYPGETSTRSYLRQYCEANNLGMAYFDEYLAPGPTHDPSPCYDPDQPLCEVSHGE